MTEQKWLFPKGTTIFFIENGEVINLETNLDRDLMLDDGDVFVLRPNRDNETLRVVKHDVCFLWCESLDDNQ